MRRAIASACASFCAQVVGDAGNPRVHVGAAQLLGADDLAGGGLDQRRPGEEDRALLAHDDRLVRHRRHVGAARRARAHHDRDLRDAFGRHRRLVVENAAEMIAVRENVGLVRQVGAARIDQVDARQPVVARDLLCAQVLLHRHRVVGAALDRRVVADDHALAPRHAADAGDDARRGDRVVVHPVRGELRQLEERRAGIEQRAHPLARQQLAAPMWRARDVAAALLDRAHLALRSSTSARARRGWRRTSRRAVEPGFDDGHDASPGFGCLRADGRASVDRDGASAASPSAGEPVANIGVRVPVDADLVGQKR